jgi:hypothetical protein
MSQVGYTLETNYTWEINGHSFELDLNDLETAERYEKAFAEMGEREKTVPRAGKVSETIKSYYEMFVFLYDALFGEGSGVKIVGEKANSRVCNEVYDNFLNFVADQKKASLNLQNNIISRYSPNRAQRRAEEKAKK